MSKLWLLSVAVAIAGCAGEGEVPLERLSWVQPPLLVGEPTHLASCEATPLFDYDSGEDPADAEASSNGPPARVEIYEVATTHVYSGEEFLVSETLLMASIESPSLEHYFVESTAPTILAQLQGAHFSLGENGSFEKGNVQPFRDQLSAAGCMRADELDIVFDKSFRVRGAAFAVGEDESVCQLDPYGEDTVSNCFTLEEVEQYADTNGLVKVSPSP